MQLKPLGIARGIERLPGVYISGEYILTQKHKLLALLLVLVAGFAPGKFARAQLLDLRALDTDRDGLTDFEELEIYKSDMYVSDSDGDGYGDGNEVLHAYDPNRNGNDKLEKEIRVHIGSQELTYTLGPYRIGSFKVSTGKRGYETPKGSFAINYKIPTARYRGLGYDYPNTKWNMRFTQVPGGGIYIHGAYWHGKFGQPVSHGCVNVRYEDMEALYNWSEIGTRVVVE